MNTIHAYKKKLHAKCSVAIENRYSKLNKSIFYDAYNLYDVITKNRQFKNKTIHQIYIKKMLFFSVCIILLGIYVLSIYTYIDNNYSDENNYSCKILKKRMKKS